MKINTLGMNDQSEALLKEIVTRKDMGDNIGPNADARKVFLAMTYLFDGSGPGREIAADSYLLHNMAACMRIALKFPCDQKQIRWDTLDYDAVFCRMMNGLSNTVWMAIRDGKVTKDGKNVFVGGLKISQKLLKLYRA